MCSAMYKQSHTYLYGIFKKLSQFVSNINNSQDANHGLSYIYIDIIELAILPHVHNMCAQIDLMVI